MEILLLLSIFALAFIAGWCLGHEAAVDDI